MKYFINCPIYPLSRYLNLLRHGGQTADYRCDGKPRQIDPSAVTGLMDHIEDLRAEPEIGPHLARICALFEKAAKDDGLLLGLDVSAAAVENAFGVLRVNAFGYTTPAGGDGRALYPQVALISHSCQPNVQQERNE